jgi:hypothetical protein
MGKHFVDQYSYLHFATGIIAFFWGISLEDFLIGHTLFEILENTKKGMGLINLFVFWPGGKTKTDTFINSFGDTIFASFGWITAYYIDLYGRKNNLYGYP